MSGENWLIEGLVAGAEGTGLCEMRLVCIEGLAVVPIRLTDRRVAEHMKVCVACADEAAIRYENVEIIGDSARKRYRQIGKPKRRMTREEVKDAILVASAQPKGCRFSQVRDAHGFSDSDGRKAVFELESDGLLIREPAMARLRDATLHYPDEF